MAKRKSEPTRHTEVELKFDAQNAEVAPSFDGLSSISHVEFAPTQDLDAVYFDTAEHDLARRRITLRRRTGGEDAGWHLKLPAGPDARTEVRLPLGEETDEVPEQLRDVVLAVVRDRPLQPVARIATTRGVQLLRGADGAVLAEFCDDEVVASAGDAEQRWREWELELVESDDRELLDRLSRRLLDAGATPAGHGSKLARVLNAPSPESVESDDPIHRAVTELIEELISWDRAVRADTDDAVHQMRVTTRKLRSLLKEDSDTDEWILDELRQLAALLGVARDAEVLAEKYDEALNDLPADLVRGPVRARLVEGARRRYETGLRRSLAAMRTPRYFRLLDALEHVVTTPPADGETVSLDSAYKRVRKAAKTAKAQAESPDRDEALHRIRKGAKRLRYTAAATGDRRVSEAAKAIQSLLGDHQDATVSRTHLLAQAEAAHLAGEDTFTYGLLHQREEELAQRCRDQLDSALKALRKAMK
ncbi:CYTH and CHAD domain-containing protein [Mycobacterium sp. ACS4331]|uniref:CYTH and CHAD domain-containing protein n=1 Tax=Mycobacterium sp. ACS4331 TaxID=1834121 RepID=UPI0007FF80E8|nr:CYTH and CHAD domain-containing protein [Mycobacterium sp. ACS4331]OBF16771.1 CHAD domain-containing protein [Mycobacterium sp. ACS4331]